MSLVIDPAVGIRRIVLVVFGMGAVGTFTELLLLGHISGMWQLVPLDLLLMSLIVLAWHAISRRSGASLRAFRITMMLFLLGGVTGTILHYRANANAKRAAAPAHAPLLAPGMMIQLGLLGLAYAYRHPALRSE